MDIRWEEPENYPSRGRPNIWKARLEPLRERPGAWAVVAENLSPSNKTRLQREYPEYEFTHRGTGNRGNGSKLYARYIGREDR